MKGKQDGESRYALTFGELLRFVHEHDRFFRRRYPGHSKERRVLGRTVKLAETFGIDVREPLSKKIAKIKERVKNW